MNLASSMQVDLSTGGKKENKSSDLHGKDATNSLRLETVTRGGRKRAVSPIVPGSVKLCSDYSAANSGYKNGVTGNPDQISGKELLSSCDSVATKLSQSISQVSTQSIDALSADCVKESDKTRNIVGVTAGPSNFSSTKLKDHCASKVNYYCILKK